MAYLENVIIAALYNANTQWQCIVLQHFNVLMALYGLNIAKKVYDKITTSALDTRDNKDHKDLS